MRGSRRRRSIYRREYEKPTDANILRLLMPSILGMLLCMVCLAGMTWAWFTSTSDAAVTTIQAAKFEVDATITKSSGESNPVFEGRITEEGASCSRLEPNETYTLELKAQATTTGYCIITLGENQYYTGAMENNDTISITLHPSNKETTISIVPHWKNEEILTRTLENSIGTGIISREETTEDKNGEQPPIQTDKDNQAEAKVETPETSDLSNNSQTSISENNSGSKSDTKDFDSNDNVDKPAGSGNSDTSGNSGNSEGPDNANFAENDKSDTDASANTGTGSSNTVDADTGNTSGDNTAIS